MGWIDDLTGGIKKVTNVVETVGDFGEAVGNAIDTVPTNEQGIRDPYAVAFASIQTKINAGQTLTASDLSNKKLVEARGYVFSEPYALESFSDGSTNSGIQTTGGLFDTALDAVTSAATGAATNAIANAGAGGLKSLVPWWKGPGGGLQMPWNDPQVAQYLKQFSLDDSYLKIYYRAPRGYVVVHDAAGRPYAVLRQIARQFGIWKPAAKPPISATDWKRYKRNRQIEKKLIKIARPALRAHSRPSAAKPRRK